MFARLRRFIKKPHQCDRAEERCDKAVGGFAAFATVIVTCMVDLTRHQVRVGRLDIVIAPLHDQTRGLQEQLLELIKDHNFTRLPVLDEAGKVIGVVNVYKVLANDDVSALLDRVTSLLVLPAEMIVTDALYRMQRSRRVMAVVQGASDRHIGIVTIKDLVEEIVGELAAW